MFIIFILSRRLRDGPGGGHDAGREAGGLVCGQLVSAHVVVLNDGLLGVVIGG
jgi:hypothetical protein